MGFISIKMNKTLFFIGLLAVMCNACFKKNDRIIEQENNRCNAISIVIDDQLWFGEVGDTLRNKLASPVFGLTKEEPLFTINQYSAKLLEGFMTKGRNIIIVKKGDYNNFELKKNQYTNPQNVYRINGKTVDDIIRLIEVNIPEMIRQIRNTEIEMCQKSNDKALLNHTLIHNKFHMQLDVPTGFKYVMHKSNFMWLKKELIGGNVSLLLYQLPLKEFDITKDKVSQIVHIRDSIGQFIQGKEEINQMITDDAYSPYFQEVKLDGKTAYETRGTWKLQNDFMTGPFINYLILDEQYNRILVLEGFGYAPSNDERDLMMNLEAIIKSVKIEKKVVNEDESIMENKAL